MQSSSLFRPFTEHPASVGETYLQHLGSALGFAGWLALAAVVCLLHALLPWLFCQSGSKIITRLHDKMVVNRHRLSEHC